MVTMSPDEVQLIVQSAVTWLAPFFPYLIKGAKLAGTKWFEALGEKGGEEAVEKAVELWDGIKKKSKDNKKVEGAALMLAEDPNDPTVQEMLKQALIQVAQKHPELAEDIKSFTKSAPSIQIDQRSGGVEFTNKGSVRIDGDVVGRDQIKYEK